MIKSFYQKSLLALCCCSLSSSLLGADITAMSDLSHAFSFYGDGRFAGQYLKDHKATTNWGNLYDFDAKNINLILLLGCESHLSYTSKDKVYLKKFLQGGGTLLLTGGGKGGPQNDFILSCGAEFGGRAEGPLTGTENLPKSSEAPIEGGGDYLVLKKPGLWTVYIQDKQNRPLLASRKDGKGTILVGARPLFGSSPDAKDDINKEWVTPLLEKLVESKPVDKNLPLPRNGITQLGNTEKIGSITYHYSDYLAPYFKSMVAIDKACRPLIEKRMGVPLSKGMASQVGLLATDGGGFSAGGAVGLAVFWGDFPNKKDGMVEFLTHESVHSWVLPYPEVWNEPIATYVGNLVQIDAGFKEVGENTIKGNIERATRLDPTMKIYDLQGKSSTPAHPDLEGGAVNDMHWGKTYWIFEELRKQDPQFLGKYFKAKRQFAKDLPSYTLDDTVALFSHAMGKDLFPWFNEHGMPVSAEKSSIKFAN